MDANQSLRSMYTVIRCDRILKFPFVYPGNYGFIPNTLSLDNDPLDVLLINTIQLNQNIVIKIKILGVLITEDESGMDEKIIAVPHEDVDNESKYLNEISDIKKEELDKIKYFFTHYKDHDDDKWIKVYDYKNKKYAHEIFRLAELRFLKSTRSKI